MTRSGKAALWIGGGVLVLLAIVAAATVAGWLYLQTDDGRRFVVRQIESAASDATRTVEVGRIDGSLTSSFTLRDIAVADRDGPIARVDAVSVAWRPAKLLVGRLDIERIAATRIDIDRLPPSGEPDAGDRTEGGRIPPHLGIDVALGALSIAELRVAEAVAGAPVRLAVDGSGALDGDGNAARLALEIRRIDGTDSRAAFAFDYAARPARFTASADISEPAGGQIARLLGIPGAPPVALRLDGKGPADDWRGALHVTAGEVGGQADISAAVKDRAISLAAKGHAEAGPLLPPWVVPLVGSRTSFDAAVRSHPEEGWRLERLALEGSALRLDGAGRYEPDRGTLTGDVAVATAAPLAMPADAPQFHAEQARVVVHVEGTVAEPRATVNVTGRALQAAGVAAGEANAELRLAIAPAGALSFGGTVRVAQLDPGAAVPPGILGGSIDAGFEGAAGAGGDVALSRLDVESGALAVSANGRYAPDGQAQGEYRVALRRLGALAAGAGLSPDGNVRLSGPFRIDTAGMTGTVRIDGAAAGLAPQGAPLAALTGDSVPIEATVERRADGTVGVSGLAVRLAAGTLRGDGALMPGGDAVRGRLELAVPNLAPLSSSAGTDLSGRGTVAVDVSGRLDELSGRAVLRLEQAAAAGVSFDEIELQSTARRTPSGASGTATLKAVRDGAAIPGRLRYALADGTVRIADMAIGTKVNRIAGDLRVALNKGLADGTLRIAMRRLSALPLPKPLAPDGTLDATIRLSSAKGQRIALDASGGGIRLPMGDGATLAVGSARLRATVEDALATPRIAGSLRASNAAYGEGTLDTLALDLRADGTQAVSFEGDAKGRYGVPLVLRFAGRSAFAGADISARLTRFEGTVAGTKVAATRPLRVALRDAANWSGEGALAIANGSVSGVASRRPDRLSARLDLDRLPLALAALAAPGVDLEGTLSGHAAIAGPPRRLGGRATLEVQGLRPRNGGWAPGDSFALSADANIAEPGLALSARLRGPQETEVDLRANVPVRIGLADGTPMLSADGRLEGVATLAGQLALVDRLIGIGENRIAGRVGGKVRLGGTVRAPQADGEVTISGGSFESVQAGTTIRDMSARMRFDGATLRLAEFAARDAGDGRIGGEGTVRFDPAAGWPMDLRLSFAEFAALARDDATLRTSGDLRLRGPAAGPRIEGRLQVDGGEMRIPDRLGGGAATLDVVEVNGAGREGAAGKPSEAEPSSPAVAIPLDILVEVPGRVFVRGRGLDSEWRGRLEIAGTTAEPKIVGDLSSVRGTFAFAGRTFVLREGKATFDGATPPNPSLAVRAVAGLKDIQAAVVVSGSASQPAIELQSEPPVSNDEILSRILFGKSFGQLNALQAAQLAQSAAQLSGGASGVGVLDRIRRTIGVDVLNVETQDDSADGAALQAGKYIAEDVFVSVDQGTKPGSQKVGVDIELTPNVTVETDVGPDAGSSVGLSWKWDY